MLQDNYIGRKLNVNNQGWIMLADYMGSDHDIAQAARVSYGAGTKSVSDDEHLIRYMMRHRHTSPFEHAVVKFIIYAPMDIWRQWVRHRTASINEYSTRYSIAIDQMYNASEWRLQSAANKQGSEGVLSEEDSDILSEEEEKFHKEARRVYEHRIKMGVAREQARKDLPLSTFTQAYWTINLHNCLHFLSLRLEEHAQKEMRDYANKIALVISNLFPMTWKAFVDYQINSVTLSGTESNLLGFYFLKNVLDRLKPEKPDENYQNVYLSVIEHIAEYTPDDWAKERCRERDEFYSKFERLLPMGEK